MSSSVIMQGSGDNTKQEKILTPTPSDKHVSIDKFSCNDQPQPVDEKDSETQCTTPTKSIGNDDTEQESKSHVSKKLETVLGKDRAIKILEAFGCQQKPVEELHHNVLKTQTTKDSHKPKKEEKSLTAMQKAKEAISEIEELRKFKDRMIPTYFGENVVILNTKVTHSLNDTRLEYNSSRSDSVSNEPIGRKPINDSLEALKVYNNLDADKQSDDEMISDREENVMSETAEDNDLTELIRKKKKLPAAFDLKAKRAKEKRRKRRLLGSRSSDKKRKRRNKNKKKKTSRESLSRRSSTNNSEKRKKRKRGSTHGNEISTCKVFQTESHSSEYSFDRFTKTLPIIKYSPNPRCNRQQLTTKDLKPKKKKRSTSKAKLEKEKRKKSMHRNNKKKIDKEKRRRRSGSKCKIIKSSKRQQRGLDKSELNLSSNLINDRIAVEGKVETNPEKKSPNSEKYVSKWDNLDNMDDITSSSMENILSLDTIPLQLNVPKQDRSSLYTNDCGIKLNDEFNQVTPRMTGTDSMVATPILSSNSSEINSQSTDSQLTDSEDRYSNRRIGNNLENYISKSVTSVKNIKIDEVNHQLIMSCMPVYDQNKHSNGETASIELLDEVITSNDGEEALEALKKSLQKKLHDIEHNDSEASAVKINESYLRTMESKPPDTITANDSSDSLSSSTSSPSSKSSVSRKKQMKKKNRKHEDISNVMLSIDENIFNLKGGIDDDKLSDNELISKVEQLKQQINKKRKALANKRKLIANDTDCLGTSNKSDVSPDTLLRPEKRSAISLKIFNAKSNSMKVKPVTFDDNDFTEKLLLEVTSTANTVARAEETNKLLIERVIEPEVGMVSLSNSSSLAVMLPLEKAITKIALNQTFPMDTSEMKNYLNNATMSHFDSSDSITSKTSASVDSSMSSNSFPAAIHKISPVKLQSRPPRPDKRDLSDLSSRTRLTSPHQRSWTKDTSSKRHYSPQPLRSPRSRRRSSHRSSDPIHGSPRRSRSRSRSRSSRKSPRRHSPRRLRKSLSPRSKRSISPIRGRRTLPLLDKHNNRKCEPSHSIKSVLDCENYVPQPIFQLENTSTTWSGEQNSAFAQYVYHHPLSPKRSSLDERIAHSFGQSDQSYDFQQASGLYMNDFEYSAGNTSKIPVLNSQESYYFQPQHLRPQNLPPQPSQLPQYMAHQHVAPHAQQHMIQNPLPRLQHLPPHQRFSNLIEIRQSTITEVGSTPFVLKGNVLEIVPNTESIVVKPLTDSVTSKLDDKISEMKIDIKVELTEEEMQLRGTTKAEMKLKRKQKREKRRLERFMRKEKLRLEIKHLMELSASIPNVKNASYNPNATAGKSILRLVASGYNKKSVLFADGVAPGDGTSTSGGEDVAPLLRDRNKRMTKRKLDPKSGRARREASIIKKEVVPQITELTPFINQELEKMPPPPPPDGSPSVRLTQPKLKSTPKLIYFHYDSQSNAMYISPYPTTVHIPQKPSEQTFSAITKLPTDSPSASSTPDEIQRPKTCFIQPPTQETASQLLPNSNQQPPEPPTDTNSIGCVNAATALPPIKLFNQQPSSAPLPNPSVLYPQRHPQSISPQNYRMPVHPAGQQSMQVQPTPMQIQPTPMQIQPLANMAQRDNSNYATNSRLQVQLQQQPCSQVWESDRYFQQTPPIRPSVRFDNSNNIPQQRSSRNPWDQRRHPTPLFQNSIHSQQPSFALQLRYNSQHPHQQWNHQYRNNQ